MVRKAQSKDWPEIRKLCCLTGKAGDPIDEARWPFFSKYWVGPYEKLLPDWAYVAENEGKVVGYLTGCPDTAAFKKACFFKFTIPLLLKVISGRYVHSSDTKRFIRRTIRLDKSPEQLLEEMISPRIDVSYPAHLHINLSREVRGHGLGKRLVNRYLEDLATRRVRGVHVFCGKAPLNFYKATGFAELASVEFSPGVLVHAMGRGALC